jgi:hypothetical protein
MVSTSLSSKLGAQVLLEIAFRPDELDVCTIPDPSQL